MTLEIKSINKSYKRFKALDDICLELEPGIWGLLGPNGAGKSTLMNIIVGNLKGSSGEIRYKGRNIKELGKEYFDNIGYLPQHFGYDKNQSVYDFLEYIGVLKGIEKNLLKKRIDSLLREFNLFEVKNKKIDNLSGGMKRRVGICQAMLNDPNILVIDEPTAGLDIEERRNFRKYLTDISENKIVIISTHIVSDVEFIANYLVLINDGQLITSGRTEDLLNTIEGRVFEVRIKGDNIKNIEQNYLVTDTRSEGLNEYTIRYISDHPIKNSKNVVGNLNDYYLSQIEVI